MVPAHLEELLQVLQLFELVDVVDRVHAHGFHVGDLLLEREDAPVDREEPRTELGVFDLSVKLVHLYFSNTGARLSGRALSVAQKQPNRKAGLSHNFTIADARVGARCFFDVSASAAPGSGKASGA